MGAGVYGKPVPSLHFCCEPKTALKSEFFKKLGKGAGLRFGATGKTPRKGRGRSTHTCVSVHVCGVGVCERVAPMCQPFLPPRSDNPSHPSHSSPGGPSPSVGQVCPPQCQGSRPCSEQPPLGCGGFPLLAGEERSGRQREEGWGWG